MEDQRGSAAVGPAARVARQPARSTRIALPDWIASAVSRLERQPEPPELGAVAETGQGRLDEAVEVGPKREVCIRAGDAVYRVDVAAEQVDRLVERRRR